jgi:hypothetical protein
MVRIPSNILCVPLCLLPGEDGRKSERLDEDTRADDIPRQHSFLKRSKVELELCCLMDDGNDESARETKRVIRGKVGDRIRW